MTTITRLSDDQGQRPSRARVYVVRNEDEERKAMERYTTRYDRVPGRVFVWRGMLYIETVEGEK